MSRLAEHSIRRIIDVAADFAEHIVIEPKEDFLFDKLLLVPATGGLQELFVESIVVGDKQLLLAPVTAAHFSREQVFPGPELPPPKDPFEGIEQLFVAWWNVMNDRRPDFGMNEDVGKAKSNPAPRGTSLGGVHVRSDQKIEIDLRNARTEHVHIGLFVIGTVARSNVPQRTIDDVCAGWEVTCPDGVRRHNPYHNLGDAVAHAQRASDPTWFHEYGCRIAPKPGRLEREAPPCPGGKHAAVPIPLQHARTERGSG